MFLLLHKKYDLVSIYFMLHLIANEEYNELLLVYDPDKIKS